MKTGYEEYHQRSGKSGAKKAKKILGSIRKSAKEMMKKVGEPKRAKVALKKLKTRLKASGKKATGL